MSWIRFWSPSAVSGTVCGVFQFDIVNVNSLLPPDDRSRREPNPSIVTVTSAVGSVASATV